VIQGPTSDNTLGTADFSELFVVLVCFFCDAFVGCVLVTVLVITLPGVVISWKFEIFTSTLKNFQRPFYNSWILWIEIYSGHFNIYVFLCTNRSRRTSTRLKMRVVCQCVIYCVEYDSSIKYISHHHENEHHLYHIFFLLRDVFVIEAFVPLLDCMLIIFDRHCIRVCNCPEGCSNANEQT